MKKLWDKISEPILIILFSVLAILIVHAITKKIAQKKTIKPESKYLNGGWYLTAPPDPYPNFPDWNI